MLKLLKYRELSIDIPFGLPKESIIKTLIYLISDISIQ